MPKESGSRPFWESLPPKVEYSPVRHFPPPGITYEQELLGGPSVTSEAYSINPSGGTYTEVVLGIPKQRDADDGIDRTGPKMRPDKAYEIEMRLNR